jgi:asparagine synthase (glutamine-hydrolysing)
MCGIWSFIKLIKNASINHIDLYQDFMAIQPRGPDLSSYQIFKNDVIVGFHRLAIMDPTFHANQPYIIEDGDRTIVFVCNGEIYNFKELIKKHNLPITTNSDCLTIPHLYIKYFNDNCDTTFTELFKKDIQGEFSFILLEFDRLQNLKHVMVGRDQIGIRPLYYHLPTTASESLIFSSELKGMKHFKDSVVEFEPGMVILFRINDFGSIKNMSKYDFKTVYLTKEYHLSEEYYLTTIRDAVISSVKKRINADKPIAFLLSGGVDSSLVAAISASLLKQPINTFCCGMNEGTDMVYAKMVADHIGSNHQQIFFTPEEGLESIKDVIYTTETWDTTTIRASVGQYLVCKHIGLKTDACVVMVGEGPDEVCSSYLFNYYAPNNKELHNAALKYVKEIHMYDGRRADRCISRWGLEGRVALLDPEFITQYFTIPSEYRMPTYKNVEKWWLRKAFDDGKLLPEKVLWRKKEAFSDGISSTTKSWFEIIQDHINERITDEEFQNNKWNCPSKEAYYYKKLFVEQFGEERLNVLPHYWQPAWDSNGNEVGNNYVDPSARTLQVYTN